MRHPSKQDDDKQITIRSVRYPIVRVGGVYHHINNTQFKFDCVWNGQLIREILAQKDWVVEE